MRTGLRTTSGRHQCRIWNDRAAARAYELDDYTDPWKNAPCIMLQHGYARSSKFWRAWVPYLSRFYRVIRPDLRGLGQSSKDLDLENGINLAGYLRDFNDLLDHLGVESVHYCGESSAGTLGMAFAAECPQRVRTLSIISAPVAMTEEDKQSSLAGHPNRIEALRKMGSRGWLEASNAGGDFPPTLHRRCSSGRSTRWEIRCRSAGFDVSLRVNRRCGAVPAENLGARARALSDVGRHHEGRAYRSVAQPICAT
jgi:pimeloyl-ACP methyl ester carboxylesterase